ncbi:major facilitator superfamily MFS_1 [Stackebrandtia nassauensis DSM 44728]|uniref:Major facilitator superfamily MFS_1 n=1 Tax=Stackebrandtia nassauensis (strain DSM 44728 / CIP 108903 / NRRL B-16338 / NBRC 102104 / LLR-40K-21) TaxID=446470 RepID=D3Q043_STANL|nr:major facilitator superfamily MFS_1 [Stackebrandtia nassauensis DSM 44728]
MCPVFLVGGLSVQIGQELHFTPSGLGLAVASYFTASALASFWAGRLVERMGSKFVAKAAILLAAGSLAAIAVAARDLTSLTLLLVLAGPANSLGQLSSNALLARKVPPKRRGLMFGVKQAAIPLSTTLAGLAVPIVALTVGWRWGFGVAAVLALLAWPVLPRTEEAGPQPGRPKPQLRPNATLVVISLAACLGATAANPVGSFIADYGVSQGMSESLSGLNLTLGGLAGVAARTTVGWMADRRDSGRLVMIAVMLAVGSAGLALLAAPGVWTIPIGTVAGFALGWAWPGLLNFAITLRYSQAPAAATGITQIGVYIGGGLGPLAFGALVDAWGYPVGWLTMAVLMLAGAVLMIVGRRMLLTTT